MLLVKALVVSSIPKKISLHLLLQKQLQRVGIIMALGRVNRLLMECNLVLIQAITKTYVKSLNSVKIRISRILCQTISQPSSQPKGMELLLPMELIRIKV